MSEAKDPKIKLFGKTIKLPDTLPSPPHTADGGGYSGGVGPSQSSEASGDDGSAQDCTCSRDSLPEESSGDKGAEEQESEKELLEVQLNDSKQQEGAGQSMMNDIFSGSTASHLKNENPGEQYVDNDAALAKASKSEEEQCETSNAQEKTPKKPDKILPCPRCNSMDTKFCYFNNYNVNQPRHFCKKCQRYWTAGGTMRNVPVGAGRRKNKNLGTHYRHLTIPETLQNVGADLPNGIQHPTLSPKGTVLTFASDTPLCDSMASVLNIDEKSMQNCSRNGFHRPEELRISVSNGTANNGDDQSNGSSLTTGNLNDEVCKTALPETVVPNSTNFSQVPCFSSGPWPYPWNSVQWSPPVPPPGFCPPGFPMPFYPPAPYWGSNPPGTWNVIWINPATTHNLAPPTSGPNSPTLGKHSRDDNKLANNEEEEPKDESNPEKCLWVPKTLRIDDPGEAAKSSIWATLGIKNEKADPAGSGLFKAFQSKGEEETPVSKTSTVLHANPAAMSRSLNFNESS